MIHVRRASTADSRAIAELLNEVIRLGDVSAMTKEVSGAELAEWMTWRPAKSGWHLAETETEVVGVQWFEPNDDLPEGACDISTFARQGHTGLGIGSRLFEATKRLARDLGYRWINAAIRADNTGGLAFYQSRGFERYGLLKNDRLDNGMIVDRTLNRYDLTV